MIRFILVFSLLIPTLSFGQVSQVQTRFGKKLEILKSEGGKVLFSLNYSLNYALKGDSFLISNFTVRGGQLVDRPYEMVAPIFVSLVDKNTGRIIIPWKESDFHQGAVASDSEQSLEFSVTGAAEVGSAVQNLLHSVLVFSLRKDSSKLAPTVYVDMQELCSLKPEAILNIDTEEIGCL